MRDVADRDRIYRFMRALGAQADQDTRVYFTGGATAVLYGWRASSIDIDVKIVPDRDPLLRAIQSIKDDLRISVELASPLDFISVPEGWEDRSPFVRQGRTFFHHFDLYAQAIAKVERGHIQDRDDVREMLRRGFIEPAKSLAYLATVEPLLYRYPAIDPRSLRTAVQDTFRI